MNKNISYAKNSWTNKKYKLCCCCWCIFNIWWRLCWEKLYWKRVCGFAYKAGPSLKSFSSLSDGYSRFDELGWSRFSIVLAMSLRLSTPFKSCLVRRNKIRNGSKQRTTCYLKLLSAVAAAARRSLANLRLLELLADDPTPPTAPPSLNVSLSRLKCWTSLCNSPKD